MTDFSNLLDEKNISKISENLYSMPQDERDNLMDTLINERLKLPHEFNTTDTLSNLKNFLTYGYLHAKIEFFSTIQNFILMFF
jgi:hypothetical protein